MTLGVGLEFLPLSWSIPLSYFSFSSVAQNKDDFLVSEYIAFGGFYDVLSHKNIALRLFANLGLGLNFLFGGTYDGNLTASYYGYTFTPELRIPITMPMTFGMRLILAKHHGLEAVLKYNPFDMKYHVTATGSLPFTTTISRDLSVGVRYVYEFK